jgi:hypothetical protein
MRRAIGRVADGKGRLGSATACWRYFRNVDYHPLYGGRVPWQSMFPAPETGCANCALVTSRPSEFLRLLIKGYRRFRTSKRRRWLTSICAAEPIASRLCIGILLALWPHVTRHRARPMRRHDHADDHGGRVTDGESCAGARSHSHEHRKDGR